MGVVARAEMIPVQAAANTINARSRALMCSGIFSIPVLYTMDRAGAQKNTPDNPGWSGYVGCCHSAPRGEHVIKALREVNRSKPAVVIGEPVAVLGFVRVSKVEMELGTIGVSVFFPAFVA